MAVAEMLQRVAVAEKTMRQVPSDSGKIFLNQAGWEKIFQNGTGGAHVSQSG